MSNTKGKMGLTIRDLPKLLSICARVADEEWKKLTPDKREKIRNNILKRSRDMRLKKGKVQHEQ